MPIIKLQLYSSFIDYWNKYLPFNVVLFDADTKSFDFNGLADN